MKILDVHVSYKILELCMNIQQIPFWNGRIFGACEHVENPLVDDNFEKLFRNI